MLRRGLTVAALVALLVPAPAVWALPGETSTGDAPSTEDRPVRLAVEARETPEGVRLRIRLPADVQPNSVELEVAGRKVVVLARDSGGEELRSGVILLAEAPSEVGAEAEVEDDGLLTVTLQKRQPAP